MPQDYKYWAGKWPMTIGRIRNFMRGFEGMAHDRLPFSCHAVNYLMEIIDGRIDPEDEPQGAPWETDPRVVSVKNVTTPVTEDTTYRADGQVSQVSHSFASKEETPFNPSQMVSDSVSDMLSDKKEDDLW